jgi:hypothetical protein
VQVLLVMFAVLMNPSENRMPLPSGVRRIAEYSGHGSARDVVLVEVPVGGRSALRELERKGMVTALAAGNMKQGFDLARSVIERRLRPTSCCRHRSESR